MNFVRFFFSFLYTRNWHTGELELSMRRVYWFGGIALLLIIAVAMIMFLQAPINYTAVTDNVGP